MAVREGNLPSQFHLNWKGDTLAAQKQPEALPVSEIVIPVGGEG